MNFVLIGAAGYIASKHFKAIKETGNNLLAAMDPHDAVGILDQYFPETDFFTEFERFDRHCEKLKRDGIPIHYVTVCSPNYLHDAHIRFGLRLGATVICEKPVVLNPWNVDALMAMEKETGNKVYTILQLRQHPAILKLKSTIEKNDREYYKIDLQYVTPRGKWYEYSWKGNEQKSGGIATNIGLHFFDFLIWIFGEADQISITEKAKDHISGKMFLEKAEVNWMLSINKNRIPDNGVQELQSSYRLMTVNGVPIDFNHSFTDLHTLSYQQILEGNGIPLSEARKSIKVVQEIRKLAS